MTIFCCFMMLLMKLFVSSLEVLELGNNLKFEFELCVIDFRSAVGVLRFKQMIL